VRRWVRCLFLKGSGSLTPGTQRYCSLRTIQVLLGCHNGLHSKTRVPLSFYVAELYECLTDSRTFGRYSLNLWSHSKIVDSSCLQARILALAISRSAREATRWTIRGKNVWK
jgi:hypothetical protein